MTIFRSAINALVKPVLLVVADCAAIVVIGILEAWDRHDEEKHKNDKAGK